ncbi:SH3 domain-containing protein [Paenibacillus sp. NPDC058071]|uniref:C40 family peptidase n=1 Tax=Paenibacillus sp. NPDC058071 TaxID=3346326 RepID=UPI0036DB3B5B
MNNKMKKRMLSVTVAASLLAGATALSVPAAYAAQSVAFSNAPTTATIKASVNFRTSPSASASQIRFLKKNEQVTVLSQPNSYWYQVQDASGQVGYVSSQSQYIALNGNTGNGGSNGGTNSSSGTQATIKASVNFRTAPSASAASIRFLKQNEQVTVLSQPNSYWYEVRDAAGQTGFVSSQSQYISVSGTVPPGGGGSTGGGSNGSGSGNGNTGGGSNGGATTPSTASVEKVIAAGMKYLGTPYEFGSDRNTTATFDCSDFVRQAFMDGVGLKLPADSRGQGQHVKNKGGVVTDWKQLKRGDLMFFMSYRGTGASSYSGVNKAMATINHVGIYLGNGQVLHTYSKESGGVRTNSIAGTHWEHRFLYGGSAL